jgi:hypothetical protein
MNQLTDFPLKKSKLTHGLLGLCLQKIKSNKSSLSEKGKLTKKLKSNSNRNRSRKPLLTKFTREVTEGMMRKK